MKFPAQLSCSQPVATPKELPSYGRNQSPEGATQRQENQRQWAPGLRSCISGEPAPSIFFPKDLRLAEPSLVHTNAGSRTEPESICERWLHLTYCTNLPGGVLQHVWDELYGSNVFDCQWIKAAGASLLG
ncbi:hypothetical protein P7K49_012607, partial [Saguinus oedipus]